MVSIIDLLAGNYEESSNGIHSLPSLSFVMIGEESEYTALYRFTRLLARKDASLSLRTTLKRFSYRTLYSSMACGESIVQARYFFGRFLNASYGTCQISKGFAHLARSRFRHINKGYFCVKLIKTSSPRCGLLVLGFWLFGQNKKPK